MKRNTHQVNLTSENEQENFLYDDVQSSQQVAAGVEYLPVVARDIPTGSHAHTLPPPPQPQPVEQSIHMVKDEQRTSRRKWLRRALVGSFTLFAATSGGLSGMLYKVDKDQQKELAAQAQNDKRQTADAQSQASAQGYQRGYSQATTNVAKSLKKIDGVSLHDAKSSADTLASTYDAYIAPIADSQASIADMLNALSYARRFIVDASGDTTAIDSLITILGSWQKNATSLEKSLSQVSTTDTTAAGQYLTSLQKQIVSLEK